MSDLKLCPRCGLMHLSRVIEEDLCQMGPRPGKAEEDKRPTGRDTKESSE